MIMKKCLYCMEDYEEVSGQCPVCGHSDSLPPAPEGRLIPGSVLMGRFLVGELQANYFDEARYIGWDQVLLRKVSIWEYMGNETESFRKTAEKIQLLDAMPGLINVWKVFEKNGVVYAILEYVGNMSLEQVLNRQAPWSEEHIRYFLYSLQTVLSVIHENGLVLGKQLLRDCFQRSDGSWCIGYFQSKPVDEAEQYDTRKLALCIAQSIVGPDLWKSQNMTDNFQALSDLASKHLAALIKQTLKESTERDQFRFPLLIEQLMNGPEQHIWRKKMFDLCARILKNK